MRSGAESTPSADPGKGFPDGGPKGPHYTRDQFDYPFPPAEVVEFFRTNYGPTARAFASLAEAEWEALRAELAALWTAHNKASGPSRTLVDAEYLEVVGVRA